jgi:hypothetical protein
MYACCITGRSRTCIKMSILSSGVIKGGMRSAEGNGRPSLSIYCEDTR